MNIYLKKNLIFYLTSESKKKKRKTDFRMFNVIPYDGQHCISNDIFLS